MPDVKLLPSPRVNPYAGENTKALMSMMQILGEGETARRTDIQVKNVLEALSRGGGREEISAAALMEPGFSGGIPGGLQRLASLFASPTTSMESLIAGKGIESGFQTLSPYEQLRAPGIEADLEKTLEETKRLKGTPLVSPSQQIAQKKVEQMDKLKGKVDAGTATENEKAMLEKMLAGQPMVQIGLGQPAAAAERTAIAETRASIDSLDNLKTLFDSAQTKTGPVTGRISPIAGLVGMTTDEQEAFMAATSAFKNAIIKEITGAQMSEVEAKRIMKQVPDITDPPTRWQAKWEQSRKNLEMLQTRRMQILEQSGLRVPMGGQDVTIGQKPSIEAEQKPTTETVYKSAIQQAKKQLGSKATDQQLLDLAEKIILGVQ